MADPLVGLLAPHYDGVPGKSELTAQLTVIMMPFLIFISLSAVIMGIPQHQRPIFYPRHGVKFF